MTRYTVMGVLLLTLFVTMVIVLYSSALEAPSGEGVPGPADWARSQSTP